MICFFHGERCPCVNRAILKESVPTYNGSFNEIPAENLVTFRDSEGMLGEDTGKISSIKHLKLSKHLKITEVNGLALKL